MSPFFNAFSAPHSALHHFGGAAILLRCKCGPNWNYALWRVYDLEDLPILRFDRPLRHCVTPPLTQGRMNKKIHPLQLKQKKRISLDEYKAHRIGSGKKCISRREFFAKQSNGPAACLAQVRSRYLMCGEKFTREMHFFSRCNASYSQSASTPCWNNPTRCRTTKQLSQTWE